MESSTKQFRLFWVLSFLVLPVFAITTATKLISYKEIAQPTISVTAADQPQVKGQATENKYANAKSISRSEHFIAKQINFGDDVIVFSGSYQNLALNIYEVQTQTISDSNSKGEKENKLLVTWKTNKLGKSQIEYSKTDGMTPKVVKEDGFSFSHSLIIGGLESGNAYIFTISSVDRWGNKVVSNKYGAYVKNNTISVFELISQEMNKIFGWALKK